MRKIVQTIFALIFALCLQGFSQITITSSDIANAYSIGSMQTTHSDTLEGSYDIGSPGGGNNWNFSGATSNLTTVNSIIDPAGTPNASDFPAATHTVFFSFSEDGITADNYFYLGIGDDFTSYGGVTSTTTPYGSGSAKTTFDPAELTYELPMTFGDAWFTQGTQTTVTEFDGVPPFTSESTISARSEVDAHGTLVFPDGASDQALRIVTRDTTESELAPGFPVTFISVTFTFVTKSGDFVTVSAADENPPTSGVIAGDINWVGEGATAIEPIDPIATEFSLKQNYPNPFNPSTTIEYSIPQSSFVELVVYDIVGKEVAVLVNENLTSGSYRTTFEGANLPSGIYFVHMKADGFSQVRKMSLLK